MALEPKISLCMIVKNEEKFLPTCINSIKDLVSEIIIVDTGSTDQTIDIARYYGAKIFQFEWHDNFSEARNESLKHATGDWILYLDADERIDEKNKAKIRRLIQLKDVSAINVRVVIPQSARNLVTEFSYSYSRIFRNIPQIRFEGRIHEQIIPSIKRLGGKIYKSDITIDHWGFGIRKLRRENRNQQNLNILKDEIIKTPDDPFLHYNLADTYRTLGETDLAINHFEKVIELDDNDLHTDIVANVHIYLAQLYLLKNICDRAKANSNKAIELAPKEPLPYYILATIYFQDGNWQKAKQKLEYILSLIENHNNYIPSSNLDISQVYLDLGNCNYLMYDFDKAEMYYQQAIEQNPDSFEISFNLGRCYQRKENLKSAKKWYERALEIDPSFEAARVNLLKCYKAIY